jgi:hypothetical protein
MSIFPHLAGVSGTAFFNLLTISGEDGGLGLDDVPGDATIFVITYVEMAGQPATADRLNTLVNTDFGYDPDPATDPDVRRSPGAEGPDGVRLPRRSGRTGETCQVEGRDRAVLPASCPAPRPLPMPELPKLPDQPRPPG